LNAIDTKKFDVVADLVVKAGERAHSSYADHAAVADTIADRLYERLTLLKSRPERILDLGTGDGRHLEQLAKRFPRATIIGADICQAGLQSRRRARRFWQRPASLVCLDASKPLPFASASFDLVLSNLLLPWILPAEVFASELNRLLTPQGAFFVSSAGPDTLRELRIAWQQLDTAEHVNAFLDMHDVGDLLHRAGISDPVMDAERLQVTYSSVDKLLDELVNTGCTTVLAGRRRGLTGSDIRQRIAENYPTDCSNKKSASAMIFATLEVVYAHGWKGKARLPDGVLPVSLQHLHRRPGK